MFAVLRHYLPLRQALLFASETLLLVGSLMAVLSSHLLQPDMATRRLLAQQGLSPEDALPRCLASATLLALLAQIAIAFNELYDFRVSGSRYERASRFVGSAGTTLFLALLALLAAYVWNLSGVLGFPGLPFVQQVVGLTAGLTLGFALLYVWRPFFHFALRRFALHERVLVVGAGRWARELAAEIAARPSAGIQIAGLLPEDDEPAAPELAPAAGPVLEPLGAGRQDLLERATALNIDTVAVALDDRRAQIPMHELLRCRMAGIHVVEGELLFERVTGKLAVSAMRPSYLVFNSGFEQHPLSQIGKRVLDLLLALIMLALLWPAMLVTALLVRLDSPGGAVYAQPRVGRHGKEFTLRKFRSMRADAEAASGPVWARADDPRITRVGKFIRKTRLDELPQLFNVLSGEMSLVGPRPERQKFVDELCEQIPYFGQRHMVKPGLTGWAQINYPYGNTVEDARQKLQYDLFYIKNQSLMFDLSILFNTIKTVVLRRGT
ncbi:MAG: TIGR03013 family PEP-CTERM/XrtA system glycosyltransferase [Planctomycetota bacterium]|nr:MAG: TIGR03013 family PEP-CTERM/XrtA system glycosyltransferase [Planctomycetota bacterium]